MRGLSATRDRSLLLKDKIKAEGACLVGFADISVLGLSITHEYPFGICFALKHDNEVVNKLPNDELWLQMNSSLTGKVRNIYAFIQEKIRSWGYKCSRISSNTRFEEFPDPGEELPQKTLATLSGIGWIGRSTLLISPEYGPRIRFGTLLTDMPLKVDSPIFLSQCGECRVCVNACPVGAIKGNLWSQTISRSELLDLTLCYNYLWSTKTNLGRRQTCGICLKTCPFGQGK